MAIKLYSIKCPECGATLPVEEGRRKLFCSYCGAQVLISDDREHIVRHIDEAQIKQAEVSKIQAETDQMVRMKQAEESRIQVETDRMVRMKQAEADRIQAEIDQMIRIKQIELAEKQLEENKRKKKAVLKVALIMLIAGVLLSLIGEGFKSSSGNLTNLLQTFSMLGMLFMICAAFLGVISLPTPDDNDNSGGMNAIDAKAVLPSTIFPLEKNSYHTVESKLRSKGFTSIECVPLNDLTIGFLKKPSTVASIRINGREVTAGGKKYPRDAEIMIMYHSLSNR